MTEQQWLIDKSALVCLALSRDADLWSNRIERGLVLISTVTRLEIGYSAQTGDVARRDFRQSPLVAMPVEYLTAKIEDRAVEVQMLRQIGANTAARRFRTSSLQPRPNFPG